MPQYPLDFYWEKYSSLSFNVHSELWSLTVCFCSVFQLCLIIDMPLNTMPHKEKKTHFIYKIVIQLNFLDNEINSKPYGRKLWSLLDCSLEKHVNKQTKNNKSSEGKSHRSKVTTHVRTFWEELGGHTEQGWSYRWKSKSNQELQDLIIVYNLSQVCVSL